MRPCERLQVEYAAAATLELDVLQAWLESYERVRLEVMRQQRGVIPTRFPAVSLIERDSRDSAGLQAVDLLLWAQRRELGAAEGVGVTSERLLERAGLLPEDQMVERNGPFARYRYVIHQGLPIEPHRGPGRGLNDLDWSEVASMLCWIEATVHRVVDEHPPSIRHLHARLALSEQCAGSQQRARRRAPLRSLRLRSRRRRDGPRSRGLRLLAAEERLDGVGRHRPTI
jgi:hypothetical protein